MAVGGETAGSTGILLLTATEVASMICRREVTAESVMCEYIKRIEAVNPAVNAVVANRFEVSFPTHRLCV